MNKRYLGLFPALAVAAGLCWQAPAMADPWSHGQNGQPRDQNWRDDRPGRADRPNGQDMRFRGQNPNDERGHGAPGPYYAGNGSRGDPRYPGNAEYPARGPAERDWDRDHGGDRDHGWDHDREGDRDYHYGRYPYPARYPAYYPNYRPYPVYGGYYGPRYYGYYGPRYYGYVAPVVYPTYYPAPVAYGPVSYRVYGGGGYGCNTDATLGVAGAVTGAIVGNNSAAPRNRGVGTVVGAVAGGIIGSAIGGAIDAAHCIGR